MTTSDLTKANRMLLRAIKTPPDTGLEEVLDCIAATLWTVACRDRCPPDPEQLCRIQRTLAELQTQASAERAEYIEQAREHIRTFQTSLERPAQQSP